MWSAHKLLFLPVIFSTDINPGICLQETVSAPPRDCPHQGDCKSLYHAFSSAFLALYIYCKWRKLRFVPRLLLLFILQVMKIKTWERG